MQYFKHTHTDGVSSLWAWLFVFWMTVIGWITSQLFITSPILPIIQQIDPDLAKDFVQASGNLVDTNEAQRMGLAFLVFVIATLIGGVTGLIALTQYHNQSTKPWKVTSALAIIVSLLSLAVMAPMANSPETSQILNKILAISPASYALVLLTFPASLILLYVGQKYVLKRSLLSLHTAWKKYRWKRCLQAVLVTWSVLGGLSAMLHLTGYKTLAFTFDPSRFFIYAAISIAFIPLQSATEEIIFRGYLNQAIENISGNKWFAFIVTSLLFMSLHLANPEALSGAEAGILPIVMSSYFLFGFAACLLLLIDDGLESAIGLHAANNVFAAVFVNYENSVLPTPSVFQIQTQVKFDSAMTIISLALIVIILYALLPKPERRIG